MADIDIVRPVEGAAQVMFNYTAASNAIDAYSTMARRLTEQGTGRVGLHDQVIVNWHGNNHDTFESAWGNLQARFYFASEVSYDIQAICGAIDGANEMQRIFNRNAEDARTNPAPPAWPEGVY
jgi:hypothetical protein